MKENGALQFNNLILDNNVSENQYIAPLMADFLTNDNATILMSGDTCGDNGKTATFTWLNVKSKKYPDFSLSFQLNLWSNGTIQFVYKNISNSRMTDSVPKVS